MTSIELSVPRNLQRGANARRDLGVSDAKSGADLLALLWQRAGIDDPSGVALLDIGCGTRLAEAILARDIPLQRYVGVDVYREMIEFLQSRITDPRLRFFYIDLYHRLYNPEGVPLSLDYRLPVGDRQFDVLSLFSVFTHLDPRDADCWLAVLRHLIKPQGRLVFSCFIDDEVSGFDDYDTEKPLLYAVYSTALMEHLITRNGWRICSAHPPERAPEGYWLIQHHYVCEPG